MWKQNESCALFILKLVSGEGVICVAAAGAEEAVEGGGDGLVLYVASRASVYGLEVWAELQIHEEGQENRKKDPT